MLVRLKAMDSRRSRNALTKTEQLLRIARDRLQAAACEAQDAERTQREREQALGRLLPEAKLCATQVLAAQAWADVAHATAEKARADLSAREQELQQSTRANVHAADALRKSIRREETVRQVAHDVVLDATMRNELAAEEFPD
jgi:hypothetical protein